MNKEKSIKDGTTYRGESGLNSGFDLYTEEEEGVKDIHSWFVVLEDKDPTLNCTHTKIKGFEENVIVWNLYDIGDRFKI